MKDLTYDGFCGISGGGARISFQGILKTEEMGIIDKLLVDKNQTKRIIIIEEIYK